MAQRRMFSPQIVESEEFLSMPVSSQALYFHLGMNADDDGFIQPKIVMRTTGANDDDLRVLVSKRFLLIFETGVVVIKHWLIHNLIQKDRYHPTRFQEEKNTLYLKDNKSYTDSVNKMLPEVRLGQDRLVSGAELRNPPEKEGRRVERFDSDEEPLDAPERVPKRTREGYEVLLQWAESERGSKFVSRPKQYKALKAAKTINLKASDLRDRWEEMASDKFWADKGFDWTNVVASFNRKGV